VDSTFAVSNGGWPINKEYIITPTAQISEKLRKMKSQNSWQFIIKGYQLGNCIPTYEELQGLYNLACHREN
jgi:hypothetical protein